LALNTDVEEIHFESDGNCGGRDHEWGGSVERTLQNLGVASGAEQCSVSLNGIFTGNQQDHCTDTKRYKNCQERTD
jgi:hypothetical protein